MSGLSMSDLVDLTRTTLEDLPKMTFEQPQKYQDYPALNRFLNMGFEISNGWGIRRNIVLAETGTAQHVRLYQSTQISIADRQKQITAPWAHANTYWAIERREALMNRAPAAFVNLLQSRRNDAMMDLANLLEERAWKSVDSSSDTLNPRGICYWITIGANSENGFYGGQTRDNSGNAITEVGGQTPVDLDRWCNYYSDYAGPTSADAMVKKMHEVFRKIQFKAPRIVKDLEQGPFANYVIAMDGDTLDAYTEYTRKANDQIGFDVGSFAGNVAFQRVPLTWVPVLDTANTSIRGTNPIYFINFNKFKPFILSDDNFREDEPIRDVTMNNVVVTFVDLSYNYMCVDRRSQALIATL